MYEVLNAKVGNLDGSLNKNIETVNSDKCRCIPTTSNPNKPQHSVLHLVSKFLQDHTSEEERRGGSKEGKE